jgi:taurine dioxygenase
MPIEINPITESFGAEVTGFDLRSRPSQRDIAELKAAWNQYLVLVLRGQMLSPEEHIRFGRHFGQLWAHPVTKPLLPEYPEIYVLANFVEGRPDYRPQRADFWHTDLTYTAKPSRAGILYARQVPAIGGDTLFANMRHAFSTLRPVLQERLLQLDAVHGLEGFADRYARATGEAFPELSATSREAQPRPNVVHSAVIRHPETGIPSLFVNPGFTIRFVGLNDSESQALLDELISHATAPENVYRHKWRKDDIVIWDNYSTMHMATGGFSPPMHRVMHRLTVSGPDLQPARSEGER